ncbi:MAG: hypothetical protein HQ518_10735 [Rhodopirellula sp.]|nr:hypothetical protein [Rhodopirellula sp.]
MILRHAKRLVPGLTVACVLSTFGCTNPTLQFIPTTLTMRRSLSIPDKYPLGSIVRTHYHQMETNGEAFDFIMHRNEFIEFTGELTSFGLDHFLEIAARARSAPFPILIERSENNSDPELDQHRRQMVALMLSQMGVPNAQARVVVSQSYAPGLNGDAAQLAYFQFLNSNNGNNGNGGGNGGGGGGGF